MLPVPEEPTMVSEADYESARENYTGFCTQCKDFTRDQTEPDADGYDCPVCGENTVVGAEDALLQGLIEVEDSE